MVIERAPLEDEFGDIVEKAMLHAGMSESDLAEAAGIERETLSALFDYRPAGLSPESLARLAKVLGLNEIGLAAVEAGRYPLPEIAGLPFCVFPLRMPHGVGVTNAYVVADCQAEHGVLFDMGTDPQVLRRIWPGRIKQLDAVFVTHCETEHVGGAAWIRERFPHTPIFAPAHCKVPHAVATGEGSVMDFGSMRVRVWGTPGHAESHNCYEVRSPVTSADTPLVITGDLIFAGSVGRAFFCRRRLMENVGRMAAGFPAETVLAPGHGPLTTLGNETRYNPFLAFVR